MDIATLLLACSVHPDDALLSSIAYVYSRESRYAVVDVSSDDFNQDAPGLVMVPGSPTAARAVVEQIVATGGEPVFGLLPVRLEWLSEFGKTLADAMEPCGSIELASAKISEFDYACRRSGVQLVQRRACTLDLYGRALHLPALRPAVLADLSLPSPLPGGTSDPEVTGPEAPTSGGLFFTSGLLGPPPSPPTNSPSLPPVVGPAL